MDREYLKEKVRELRDVMSCEYAVYVLGSNLPPAFFHPPSCKPDVSTLHRVLEFVPAREIIEGVIYAYRDWSAQPNCDRMLGEFDLDEVMEVFLAIPEPHSLMKLGVLGLMSDSDRPYALQLARLFDNPDESIDLLAAVRYELREEASP